MPEIELKRIQPSRLNPRLEFKKDALDQLADTIKQVGLLEPIIVRRKGKAYEVVAGERRYRAARQVRLQKVRVIVRDCADDEVLELNLIENIQREDLSAVEKAKVCQKLREQFPHKYPTWERVAQHVGVDVKTLRNWTQTLDLPKRVQRLIAPKHVERVPQGKIDYQTAVRIARTVKKPHRQVEIAREFSQRQVSWRAARQILKEVGRKPQKTVQTVMRQVIDEAPVYLPFSKIHADAIVRKRKTQSSRRSIDPRLREGAVVRAQVTHFADLKVVDVSRKRLGDFDEKDAKREGGYTLSEFKKVWKRLHGVWNPREIVYVVQFRLLNVMGEES